MGIEGYPLNPPWWFFCMKTLTVRDWHESSSPTNAGAASIWYASFQITNWNYMLVWKNITQMFHVWNIFTYILFCICMVNVGYYTEYLGHMVTWSTYKPGKLDFFQQQFHEIFLLFWMLLPIGHEAPLLYPVLKPWNPFFQGPLELVFADFSTGAMLRALW